MRETYPAAPQQRGCSVGVYRTTVEITLRVVAPCGPQKARLRPGFDALGNEVDAEFVREANSRLDDCRISQIVRDAKHQFLRDLQPVNRIDRQIFERRKASPEIVDRNAQSHLPKTLQGVTMFLRGVHQDRLGQLKFDSTRFNIPFGQTRSDIALEVANSFKL